MHYLQEALKLLRQGDISKLTRGAWHLSTNRFVKTPVRQFNYRISYRQAAPDPFRVIHIDPSLVECVLAPRFHGTLHRWGTYIRDGNWDQRLADEELVFAGRYEDGFHPNNRMLVPFEKYVFYQSCVQHFEQDMPWEDTEFYQWILDNLDKDILRYETREAVVEQLAYVDELYADMKENGYKSQAELEHESSRPTGYDEVLVNIGRDGRFILDDGRHRLTIAKLLDIDRIPVRVFVRHTKWQQRRYAVATGNSADSSALREDLLDHPDLQDL